MFFWRTRQGSNLRPWQSDLKLSVFQRSLTLLKARKIGTFRFCVNQNSWVFLKVWHNSGTGMAQGGNGLLRHRIRLVTVINTAHSTCDDPFYLMSWLFLFTSIFPWFFCFLYYTLSDLLLWGDVNRIFLNFRTFDWKQHWKNSKKTGRRRC